MTERRITLSAPAAGAGPFRLVVLAAGILLSFAALPQVSGAAELRVKPAISLSEEYNDNIFLVTKNDKRQEDYISEIAPGIQLLYKTDLWDWDLNYTYFYRHYAGRKITDDTTQTAKVMNKTELIDKTFFVALSDRYTRVSLNVAHDYSKESSFVNQTDENVFTVNPTLIAGSTARSTFVFGYRYVNTWYKEIAKVDPVNKNFSAVGTIEQSEYAEMTTELSSRTTLTTGARYGRNVNEINTFDKFDVYAGTRYAYTPTSSLYFSMGNSLLDFEQTGRTTQPFWNAGFTHQYSTMTLSFDTGLHYLPDPLNVVVRADHYRVTVTRKSPRATLEVDGVMTEYRNPANKHLQTASYLIGGSAHYALSPTSTVAVDLSVERLRDYTLYVNQDVYLNRLRFEHRILENLTVAAEYRYSNAYSATEYTYNYYNNRAFAELSMVF